MHRIRLYLVIHQTIEGAIQYNTHSTILLVLDGDFTLLWQGLSARF